MYSSVLNHILFFLKDESIEHKTDTLNELLHPRANSVNGSRDNNTHLTTPVHCLTE